MFANAPQCPTCAACKKVGTVADLFMSGGTWIRVHANGAILRTSNGQSVCNPGVFPPCGLDRDVCSASCLRELLNLQRQV